MGKGYSTVVEVLVADFSVTEGGLSPESTMEDLNLDSLTRVEVAVALENRTGLHFSDDQVTLDTTVGQIAAVIDASWDAAAETTAS
ncbi:acyl carrier protein [Streptomyces violascens]|uniref:Carrier domain-containing protein n=1 Tax=Streptomyces violascens TaxID=67381 RepID=A0ABQ3QSG7_9ACTN|nr:phosphopantetheine-binding protein [Streptomyces violascens]GGU32955.1 hypothetical protein GCM10010289_62730 [Streptomyces violascens]GHI40214.1 hypothetical protein Sviol_46220 [Streptomyces violascens]